MLLKIILIGYSKIGIINALPKFLRNNPEAELYLNNILAENSNWETIRNIVYSICFDEQLKHCKNCGKEMKYSQIKLSYCSNKCRASSKEVREKCIQTCLEKLGCEYPTQNKEVREKIKQTNLERYNVENIFQSEEFQEKFKQTCLERFGCEYASQSEEIKQILHNKSYDNFILSFVKYGITPLFPKEEYNGWDKTYKWKCLICQNEFEQKIRGTGHVKECQLLPRCWNCYPRLSGESRVELELLDFVKQYFPNAHKDNELIKPHELDIVIDELKLAIEFNGDYWHSTKCWLENHDNLDEYYGHHLNKTINTNKKEYRLIHIWESEWTNNKEEIQNKLKDILEGKENLTFIEDVIKLDKSWYNNIEIPGYKLIEELPPEIIKRNGFNVENCGYLVYKRIN